MCAVIVLLANLVRVEAGSVFVCTESCLYHSSIYVGSSLLLFGNYENVEEAETDIGVVIFSIFRFLTVATMSDTFLNFEYNFVRLLSLLSFWVIRLCKIKI